MTDIMEEIKNWMYEAGELIKQSFNQQLKVMTKSGRTDLVTNLDQATQDFLIQKIKAFDPTAKILGEENGQNHLTDFSGRVFIIDPIDGTMNFVLEQENFCIMIGVYQDGVGQLGFIYNVMKNEFLWGGRGIGVYCNDQPITMKDDFALSESLVGLNHVMYQENVHQIQAIGEKAMGVRMTGCAGLELSDLLMGRRVAYISKLAPWDYAAGDVLLQELGFKFSNLNGNKLTLNGRENYLGATPKAYQEILSLANS